MSTRVVVSVVALFALANCGGSSSSSGGDPGGAGTGGTQSTGGSAGVGGTGGLVFDGGPGTGATGGSIESPPLPSCGPPPAPYAGTLCGPADRPCKILSKEDVGLAKKYWVDAALALDTSNAAHVLMSWSDQPEATIHLRRDTGGWSSANIAGDARWMVPFAGAAGELWTFLYDGSAGSTELHRWNGELWSLVENVSGFDVYRPNRVLRSSLGCIHAGGSTQPSDPAYGVRDPEGKWTIVSVPGSEPPALALGPDGRPHLAYWASNGVDKRLFWSTLPGTAESIATDGSTGFDPTPTPVVVAPDGSVHVVYKSYPPGDGKHPMLTYSVRAPSGGWSHHSMATTAAKTEADCGPPIEGAPPCAVDYVSHWLTPTSVSSGAGDIRFFVARTRLTGTLAVQCYPPGPGGTGGCSWTGSVGSAEESLDLYWLQGTVVEHAPIADGAVGLVGAAVDVNGKLHLAVSTPTDPALIQYLVLGT